MLFGNQLGDSSEGEIYEEYIKWKQQKKFNSARAENYSFRDKNLLSTCEKEPEDEKNEEFQDNDFRKFHSQSEDRRITLDISSDEVTLKEFLDNKQRQWEKVKQNLENDIKIKHLLIINSFSLYNILFKAKEFTSKWFFSRKMTPSMFSNALRKRLRYSARS